jgi:AcrR family transcriptional regulator
MPARERQTARTRRLDRREILDVASGLLMREGPRALSMRRVAQAVGSSTMVLYTEFGAKDGLMSALLAEGFRRFAAALAAARGRDPWQRVRALGHAYRGFALQHPTYYALMWSPSAAELRPSAAGGDGEAAFLVLQNTVTEVMTALDRPARDIEPAAMNTWALVHGFCSLELAGRFPSRAQADAAYETTLDFVEAGLRG